MAISKKVMAIIAVVVVLVIIVAAAAALNGGNTKASDNNNSSDNSANTNTDNTNTNTQTTVKSAENSNMKAVVSDVLIGTNETAPGSETYLALDSGKHFVTVMFNVTSKSSSAGSAPALFWKLYTSDGQISTVSISAKSTYPDGLQPGATAQYVLVYGVADNATPTKLVYDGVTDLEISLT